MHTTLKRYSDWNIILNQPFNIPSQPLKPIRYASRETLIGSVHQRFMTHNPEPFILETDYEPPAQKNNLIATPKSRPEKPACFFIKFLRKQVFTYVQYRNYFPSS